jgi:hypothetical protein
MTLWPRRCSYCFNATLASEGGKAELARQQ